VRGRLGAQPGFTLIEMLMAVALISIVAVAASPAFIQLMRDRRVNRQAMWVASYLRTARLRAMARGLPVVVQANYAGATCAFTPNAVGTYGTFRMLEIGYPPPFTGAPPNCNSQDWSVVSEMPAVGQAYETPGFCTSMGDGPVGARTYDVKLKDATPAVQAFGEICYSALGRAYVRFGPGGPGMPPFSKLVGVLTFEITNEANENRGVVPPPRIVFVPPNGPARMQL
jgi:prepilin-type N-terminal cleavage/methylation domain-containing protein